MAYNAVVCLTQTIYRLLDPLESMGLIPNTEVDLIRSKLHSLRLLLEQIKLLPSNKRVESLERQVKDAVVKSEDLIGSHLSDRFPSGSECSIDESFTFLISQELLKVNQEISSFTEAALKAEEENKGGDEQEQSDSFASDIVPSIIDSSGKRKMVGLDYEQERLKDWLFSDLSNHPSYNGTGPFRVMLVSGMVGIGKTTLVKQVYDDPLSVKHFHNRLFLPIGPQSRLREILLLALDQLGVSVHPDEKHNNGLLGDYLFASLDGSSYLIVLDDVWNTRVSDELKLLFPDDYDDRSRVILTSRLRHFNPNFNGRAANLILPFLNDDESWGLLHDMVFTYDEHCPPQLVKIGKKIAKKCEGLPLAIIEVARLLRKTEKTVQEWEIFEEKEDPFIVGPDDDSPLSKALLLSYKLLPQYVKVCFLYMGVFPKHYEIFRPKLFRLWISEGFLQVKEGSILERSANDCLGELILHNVVLKDKLSSLGHGPTKTCRLHFTFRGLCVNIAKREKVFLVISKYNDSLREDIYSQQRLCTHNNVILSIKEVQSWMESVPDARSLLCYGPKQRYPIALHLPFRLLKVLDALAIRFYEFPHQVLELVHLRYLAITCDGDLPHSISRLWNLETLILHRHHHIIRVPNAPVYLPVEIWRLRKLRHLECMGLDLPDPLDDPITLESLFTLSGVSARGLTVGILERLPNLIKLGIQIESSPDSSVEVFSFPGDVTYFGGTKKLLALRCVVANPCLGSRIGSFFPALPIRLMHLTLSGCGFSWEYMRYLSRLENLRKLKLQHYAFCGEEWKVFGEGFPELEFLLLKDLDIQHWEAESEQFPNLQRLIIRHCYKLREVPPGFGEDSVLELIEVDSCSLSAGNSARRILDAEPNDYLQVLVHSSADDKKC